ncbi:hypothetical protein SAMN05444358_103134 [Ruegeria halocynthiae]|uniref:Lipoprotein n=1 Tax=Ruegeria halocynthiae TaxID=985054 RepID=A0A1H2Z923_9RHOB|nr:hypothetical protein [Ruegeria halocynthiae]SDX13836.1 hypothetical protein SAMN05444358_103134 [Ruegeria halocynthiae]
MVIAKKATGLLATLALTVLSACAPSGSSTPAEVATTQEAVSVFERTCLASLPNFADFSEKASAAGLQKIGGLAPLKNPHQLPNKRVIVGLVDSPSGVICNFTVDSNDDPKAVGSALLASARKAVGRGQGKSYPSSFYEYAVQLPNGSLITQNIRKKGDASRSQIFLSAPISAEQIPPLIYN